MSYFHHLLSPLHPPVTFLDLITVMIFVGECKVTKVIIMHVSPPSCHFLYSTKFLIAEFRKYLPEILTPRGIKYSIKYNHANEE
jgi:hypothetical protein